MSPAVGFEPEWGLIFCCDGAGCGDVCDPWCSNADPVQQERFIASQHLGYVDLSLQPYPNHCDDERCCGEDDY